MDYINNKKTKEEEELINDFNLVKTQDMNNKLAVYIIENSEKLKEFIESADERIDRCYEEAIKNLYPNRVKRALDDLNIRGEIIRFKKREYKKDYTEENKLITNCLSAIINKPFAIPSFFDEFIARRHLDFLTNQEYQLNEKLIKKVYGYI